MPFPRLINELVQTVFRYGQSLLPREADRTPIITKADVTPFDNIALQGQRTVRADRRKLTVTYASVCSQWREVVHEEIFKKIILLAEPTLFLRQVLRRLRRKDLFVPNGHLVRELAIWSESHSLHKAYLIYSIIKSCPYVQYMAIDFNFCLYPFHEAVIDTIGSNASHLKSLVWSSRIGSRSNSVYTILENASNLEFLSLYMFLDYSTADHCAINLPHLHTLHLIVSAFRTGDLVPVTDWFLPSLRRVILNILYRVNDEDVDFFIAHGRGLHSLEVQELTGDFNVIMELCPNLQDLTIHISTHILAPICHQSLTQLSIRGVILTEDNIDFLTDTLCPIVELLTNEALTPNLRTVKLLEFDGLILFFTPYSFRVRSLWISFITRLESRNVILYEKNNLSLRTVLHIVNL